MVTATPDTLGDVLSQIVQAAAEAAAAVPHDLQQVFDQAGHAIGDVAEQAQDLPAAALAAVKQLIDPPDWKSLLILILVKISELDPDHLKVGAMQPAGWSRTLTLTYTLEPGKSVTVGFAMTDPAPAKHGFILQATAGLALGPIALGPLTFAANSVGDASWRLGFAGPLEKPAQNASLNASLRWDPKISVGDATAGLSLGPLGLTAALSTGAPLYQVTLGAGDGGARPGADAKIDLSKLLGALGAIVHITPIEESYSPKLVLTQNAGPQFTLGQASHG